MVMTIILSQIVNLTHSNVGRTTFCRTHLLTFGQLTKKTAFLKAYYKNEYFKTIKEWEEKHAISWSEWGIKYKGVSLMR